MNASPPQYPGIPPNDFITNNSKGIAAGYTCIASQQSDQQFPLCIHSPGRRRFWLEQLSHSTAFADLDDSSRPYPLDSDECSGAQLHRRCFLDQGSPHYPVRHQLAPDSQQPPIKCAEPFRRIREPLLDESVVYRRNGGTSLDPALDPALPSWSIRRSAPHIILLPCN